MWEKLKNDKAVKDLLTRLITILIVAAAALLLFDVLTQSKDGRRQIVDLDGGSEYTEQSVSATDEELRLAEILSQMKGAGETTVMISYQNPNGQESVFGNTAVNSRKVEGVIVASKGAGNVVIRSSIINAVAMLFDIPASNVIVYEKSDGKEK